jgi:hypothetical protein
MHIPIIPYTRNNKGLMKQLISNWNWFEVTIQFHLATGVHVQWGSFKTTSHPRVQFEWNNDENSWHPGEDITLMWIIIIITTSHQERIACCNNHIFPVRCNMDPHMYHSLARGRRGFWSEDSESVKRRLAMDQQTVWGIKPYQNSDLFSTHAILKNTLW